MSIKTVADSDPWLEPYRSKLEMQQAYIKQARRTITGNAPLSEWALGHLYFGLHKMSDGWVLREWAPNATAVFLHADINNWEDHASFSFSPLDHGVWELRIAKKILKHADHFKLNLHWEGGYGRRIPAYARYVVQDETTKAFDAVVWDPEIQYDWKNIAPDRPDIPLIYEAHVGMSSEEPAVATYRFFTQNVLPRIKKLGYNTVQLMAVQEHPYYGSFGYHVSNFFAASSRFGSPDDLKYLIDSAHGLGLRVIMDLVHSHAVKNEEEGLSRFDGTYNQYFHEGDRGNHTAWDSRIFDYGKSEVTHFLLSNIRYWLDEFRFDGFRFDGVTSMLYRNHGLEYDFSSYEDYVSENVDLDSITYLSMANDLAHSIRPDITTIAEDTSAYPGLAAPTQDGGVGFDYRLSMGVPDLWIRTLKEKRDEDWDLAHLFHELTAHRPEEKTISYSESHDQALVGDKTLIFRLVDKEMYDHMQISDTSLIVERGIALHKMIRLVTASTHGGGYLNFMGNEFGHPEWIDFPREGNGWSYKYARRQWSLADSEQLKYRWLQKFDEAMLTIIGLFEDENYHYVMVDNERKLLSFVRSGYLFVFNFSPDTSYTDHAISTFDGDYSMLLSTDSPEFGGHDRTDVAMKYPAKNNTVKLYIPSRTAIVYKRD